jgi:hypothetical protein
VHELTGLIWEDYALASLSVEPASMVLTSIPRVHAAERIAGMLRKQRVNKRRPAAPAPYPSFSTVVMLPRHMVA